jgi:phospholipid-binding lipoprotein MlaA
MQTQRMRQLKKNNTMVNFRNNQQIMVSAILSIAKKAYILPAALIFTLLNGCTTIAVKNPVDPWESWNRSVSNFNDSLDNSIVKPVATAYISGTPQLLRTGVSNFFSNLTVPWTVVNSTLQLKPKTALDSFFRFTINTLLGLGGVLDIASEMNIERHTADFGQTLGHYGVPPGPYLVLPFLGSSTFRDSLASTIISRGDLVWQLNSVAARNSLYALRLLDIRANLLRSSSVLEAVALDKYTFTRDIYLQVRRNDILDGKEPPEDPSEAPEFKETLPPEDKSKTQPEKKSEISTDPVVENTTNPEIVAKTHIASPLPESGTMVSVTAETEPNPVLDIKTSVSTVSTASSASTVSEVTIESEAK